MQGKFRKMVRGSCTLSDFERRLFCAKRRVGDECLRPWFLKRRCPYLKYTKEDVIREARKGVKEIRTMGGFTEEAIEYAKKFRPGLRLINGEDIIKQRKRRASPKVAA